MENKNIILLGILIIGILGFLYSSNITSYATKNSCSDTDEGINSVSFGECKAKGFTYSDSCSDYRILSERFCNTEGNCASVAVRCLTQCIEGICLTKIDPGEYEVHVGDIYFISDKKIKIEEIDEDGGVIISVNGSRSAVRPGETKVIEGVKFENLKLSNLLTRPEEITLRILFPSYHVLKLKESISIDRDSIDVKEIKAFSYVVLIVNDKDYKLDLKKTIRVGDFSITNAVILDKSHVMLNINKFEDEE